MSYQPWQKGSGTSTDTTSKMNDILGNLQSSLNELASRSNTMEQQISSPRFNPSAPKTSKDKQSPFKIKKITAPTVIYPGDKPKVAKQDSINNFPPPPSEKPQTSPKNTSSSLMFSVDPPNPTSNETKTTSNFEPRASFQAPSFPAPPPPEVSTNSTEKFKINDIDDLLDDIGDMNLDSPLANKKIGNAPTENNAPSEYIQPSFTKPKSNNSHNPPVQSSSKPTGFNLYNNTPKRTDAEAEREIENAIKKLQSGLDSKSTDIQQLICFKCGKPIEKEAATVLGQNYHPECFTCSKCLKQLETGVEFFVVGQNQPFCKVCYEDTLTTCYACGQKITQGRIVKALGHEYRKFKKRVFNYQNLTCISIFFKFSFITLHAFVVANVESTSTVKNSPLKKMNMETQNSTPGRIVSIVTAKNSRQNAIGVKTV